MTLTADRLVAGAAAELAAIAADLRCIEAALAPEIARLRMTAALQGFDAVLQRLDGLASVLSAEAAALPPHPLPDAAARIEGLRLAMLAQSLLGRSGVPEGGPPRAELF